MLFIWYCVLTWLQRRTPPPLLLLVMIAAKPKTNTEHVVGLLEVGNYPTWVDKLVGLKLLEVFWPLEGDTT